MSLRTFASRTFNARSFNSRTWGGTAVSVVVGILKNGWTFSTETTVFTLNKIKTSVFTFEDN